MSNDKTCTCPSGDGSLRHPCPAHPATLATVKHGGCVQLGDWLPPLPASSAYDPTTGEPLFSVSKIKLYAQAALSAQSSPAGQGDAQWRIENETTVRTTDCPNVAERYRVRGYLVTLIEGGKDE